MSVDGPCYLYGFLRTPDNPLPTLVGVFGAPVLTDADGELAAIVSPMPVTPPRAARDDVLAHSDVLQAMIGEHDVLPAAFGTVYPEGFDVAALPRGERRSILRLLDDLAGRIEYQAKATYDELGVTQAIVEGDARLRRMKSRPQNHSTQLAIGTRFAEQLDRRKRGDADAAAKRLSRVAERIVAEPPSGQWGAFKLSMLVQRSKQDDLQQALYELGNDHFGYLAVDWMGPLPPYSFVQPGKRKRAS